MPAACRQAGKPVSLSNNARLLPLPASGCPLCIRLAAPTWLHACPPCRDLKPHNLLVSEGGLIKLADLGISAVLDRVFAQTLVGDWILHSFAWVCGGCRHGRQRGVAVKQAAHPPYARGVSSPLLDTSCACSLAWLHCIHPAAGGHPPLHGTGDVAPPALLILRRWGGCCTIPPA